MAMIVFNLGCDQDHRFEGWFGSAGDFESQRERGLLACPVCGSTAVTKQLSAPRLNLSSPEAPRHAGDAVAMVKPDAAALAELIRKVVENTEDVGRAFAEEARRIHYREAPARSIRGLASGEEARALAEEGIEVAQLPFAIPDKTQVN